MFERFTDRARRVVVLASEEAHLLNHGYVGTEHMLLGLIHEGEGVACQALIAMGVDGESILKAVEDRVGVGTTRQSGHVPFTPRAKKIFEFALREALQLDHNYIGTEHLLLGLLRLGEGTGFEVLREAGVEGEAARKTVLHLLAGYGSLGRSEPTSSILDLTVLHWTGDWSKIVEHIDPAFWKKGSGGDDSWLDLLTVQVHDGTWRTVEEGDYILKFAEDVYVRFSPEAYAKFNSVPV